MTATPSDGSIASGPDNVTSPPPASTTALISGAPVVSATSNGSSTIV